MVFQQPRDFPAELVDNIVELSKTARKNVKDLEKELDTIKNWTLKDGVQFIIDGLNKQEIKEIMILREKTRNDKEAGEANVMKKLGDYSPAFGMVGTLIGLVIMMFSMGAGGGDDEGGDMAAQLGTSMSIALITTFYGAVLANLCFLPFAEKINSRNKESEISYKDGIKDGRWTVWYDNGQKSFEKSFNVGEKDGLWIEWSKKGKKKSKQKWKNGKKKWW